MSDSKPMRLTWETPPTNASGGNKRRWASVLEALQQRPNEWAVVYEQDDNETENDARNRRGSLVMLAMRRGCKVEAVSRRINGQVKIFARVIE